jgi:tetratricopeptide (TPR) repeat protein
MKRYLFLFIACACLTVSAQETLTDSLQTMYENRQFDKIISEHANKANTYSAKAIYYIGMAYYMKADDLNCLKFMDLSIEKNDQEFDPYYIKGMTYNYMKQFDKAVPFFKKAITITSENAVAYTGLGDAYFYQNKLFKALEYYQKATFKENASERPFSMIPQVYAQLGNAEKALEAFYMAKANIPKESQSYRIALYNIGLYELIKKNYDVAENAFQELLTLVPNDYQTFSKMIQLYYGKKAYEKAKPYREALYEAHKKGLLPEDLRDMFCIDQFTWKEKEIRVFERYQEKPDKKQVIFNKHHFYIVDEKGEIKSRIQTEYSAISLELGGPKYLLGKSEANAHFTFANLAFNDPIDYETLKAAVLKVLNEEVEPTSSSYKE